MTDQKITVEQLMEKIFGCGFATSKEHYNTLLNGVRTMIEQFAAQQRADAVQQLQLELEIQKQRVVDLGVLCLESVPRESLDKQKQLYDMAVKGRSDMREALRNERDKVQQLQQRNDDLSRVCALMRKALNTICMETGNEKHCAIATGALMEEIKVRRGRS